MKLFAFFFVLITMGGCSSSVEKEHERALHCEKETLSEVNKSLFELELDDVEDYLKRINFQGIGDSTGLFYEIYNENSGISPEINDKVCLSGRLLLLDGSVIYDSKKDGNLEFVLGKGYAEKGLERVVMRMRKGERAKVIMCSHLAYGLTGNVSRGIPPKAPLIYEIKLENIYIKNKK